jgi:MFS family permease
MIAQIRKVPKVFYGWWIVGACFILAILYGGIYILGFTAFFEPIVNEFDWSYAQVSFAASLRGVNVGLLAPLMGFLVDRWGPRRLMVIGVILLSLSLLLLSQLSNIIMFYFISIIVATGISGLSPTVTVATISNWFRKKVSLATGIMACGFALGSLLVPTIVKSIDIYGWRTTSFILGFVMLSLGIPLTLIIRHKPEQYGYLPDGYKALDKISSESVSSSQLAEEKQDVRSALKSRSFWHIGIAMTLFFLPISAVTVHVMPYLSSVGIEREDAGLVAMAIPLVSIVGRISAGWLGDKFKKIQVAAGFILLVFLGLLFFSFISVDMRWLVIPFIILFGVGWGSNFPMRAALVREYFGRYNLGTIFGFLMGLTAMGGVIGPILAGWIYDNYGSYRIAWLLFSCLAFAAMIIMIKTPPLNNRKGLTAQKKEL